MTCSTSTSRTSAARSSRSRPGCATPATGGDARCFRPEPFRSGSGPASRIWPIHLLPGLTVVLPAHDEADNILGAIDDATAAAERFAIEHEIVVVDDGSTDSTAPLVERLDRTDVVLVRHGENRGYGAALRSGLAAARMPWVLLTDADRQFDLAADLGRLASVARNADLVLGWRTARQDPLARRVAGWGWNRLVALKLGLRVRDVDCAFKLVRHRIVQDLDLRSDGAAISAELVLRSLEAGAQVREIGVMHRPRAHGRATGGDVRVAWRGARELAALRRHRSAQG